MFALALAAAGAGPPGPHAVLDGTAEPGRPRTRFARAIADWKPGQGFAHPEPADYERSGYMPSKMVGMYVLVSDNGDSKYKDSHHWTPRLHQYQVEGANVIFMTFVDPKTMEVPVAMRNLAASRGKSETGSVPHATKLIVSVGGQAYSASRKSWPFMKTPENARAMAATVSKWQDDYGVDGIDIDIEWGAGNNKAESENLVTFIAELGSLNPHFIITQPVYGYPQVTAESHVVNSAFGSPPSVPSNSSIDRVGIMVYDGDASLQYVDNYCKGASKSVPQVHVNVPPQAILVGIGGGATAKTMASIVSAVAKRDLSGMFVWYGSLLDSATGKPGLEYGRSSDAASWPEAEQRLWKKSLRAIKNGELLDYTYPPPSPPPPPLAPDQTCYDKPPPAHWGCCRGSCAVALEMRVCNEGFLKGPGLCNETCGRCPLKS